MNKPEGQTDYLLLFRGNDWGKDLSPAELEQVVADWYRWFEDLIERGKALSGKPLKNEGKLVSGPGGSAVSDGPFAESKEAIGGYFYLRVADEAEAISIARRCPALDHGLTVEVRPVAEMCMMHARVLEEKAAPRELALADG